eukprot:scaffold150501_cov31-Tisochrysis_lutea.AAC.1
MRLNRLSVWMGFPVVGGLRLAPVPGGLVLSLSLAYFLMVVFTGLGRCVVWGFRVACCVGQGRGVCLRLGEFLP